MRLEVEPHHVDPTYVLWATARLVDTDKLPTAQITVRIDLCAQPEQQWMLQHRPQVELCIRYPGTAEDLIVHTAADALTRWQLCQLTGLRAVRVGQRNRWSNGGG